MKHCLFVCLLVLVDDDTPMNVVVVVETGEVVVSDSISQSVR